MLVKSRERQGKLHWGPRPPLFWCSLSWCGEDFFGSAVALGVRNACKHEEEEDNGKGGEEEEEEEEEGSLDS